MSLCFDLDLGLKSFYTIEFDISRPEMRKRKEILKKHNDLVVSSLLGLLHYRYGRSRSNGSYRLALNADVFWVFVIAPH